MAKFYGTAGANLIGEARKRTRRFMVLLTFAMVFFMGGLGFMLGLWQAYPQWRWLTGILLIAVCAVAYLLHGTLDHLLDVIANERRRFVRGEEGEALVGWLLEDLPDTYHVFHGVQFKAGSDIDHIVVGPGGVFVISTKNLRGHAYFVPGQGFLLNGKPRGDLLKQTLAQAMALRDKLKALTETEPFVNAVLALPWGFVDVRNPVDHVWVSHRDDLVKAFEAAPKRLEPAQVENYVKTINTLREKSVELTRGTVNKNTAAGKQ